MPGGDKQGDESEKHKLLGAALGPAAKNFGQEFAGAGTEAGVALAGTVRVLLLPVKGLVWGVERVFAFAEEKIQARLASKHVPPESVQEPSRRIAGPALQAMNFTADGRDDLIREMFANLIAADMDGRTPAAVHPSFVEIVKQMTVLDATTLKNLHEKGGRGIMVEGRISIPEADDSSFARRRLAIVPAILSNNVTFDDGYIALESLSRFGLIELDKIHYPSGEILRGAEEYLKSDAYEGFKSHVMDSNPTANIDHQYVGIYITQLGRAFVSAAL